MYFKYHVYLYHVYRYIDIPNIYSHFFQDLNYENSDEYLARLKVRYFIVYILK